MMRKLLMVAFVILLTLITGCLRVDEPQHEDPDFADDSIDLNMSSNM